LIKPDIIFFGEFLNAETLAAAQAEVAQADLLLVLGSSLVVQPAGYFPQMLVEKGGKIVIFNDRPTPADDLAELRFADLQEFWEQLALL
jgi:NAD-dependent deacetylase